MFPFLDIQSYWFTYDADNRVAIFDGGLVNGQATYTYDADGHQLTDSRYTYG